MDDDIAIYTKGLLLNTLFHCTVYGASFGKQTHYNSEACCLKMHLWLVKLKTIKLNWDWLLSISSGH